MYLSKSVYTGLIFCMGIHVLFMFFVFIYIYLCPSRFLYHMMLVSLNSNTTGFTCGAVSAYPFRAPEFTPSFQWGSCCSIFSFLCNLSQIAVCPFVLFLLAKVLTVHLRFTLLDTLWYLHTFLHQVCPKPKNLKVMLIFFFLHLISHIINDGKIQLKHSIGIMILYLLEIIETFYWNNGIIFVRSN